MTLLDSPDLVRPNWMSGEALPLSLSSDALDPRPEPSHTAGIGTHEASILAGRASSSKSICEATIEGLEREVRKTGVE